MIANNRLIVPELPTLWSGRRAPHSRWSRLSRGAAKASRLKPLLQLAARGSSLSLACLLVATLACLLFAGPANAAQKQGTVSAPRDAKCPVCGMLVAKYADWNATVVQRDGSTTYFDGPKDLFTYYLNPQKYDPAKKRQDIAAITVKDYYSLATIDARKAYFVTGSNVLGPMGKELIPFARKEDAEGFRSDHQGRRVLRFQEVTLEILKSLQ